MKGFCHVPFFMTAALLGGSLALGAFAASRPDVGADAAAEMRSAVSYYDSLIAVTRDERDPAAVSSDVAIGLGYLERLRLGLGSPFRLTDYALHDPRLATASRSRVGWALLGRLRRGEAYTVESVGLDGLGLTSDSANSASGADHVALIQGAVEAASDPRAGELAVRIAYSLAAAERTVSERAVPLAAQIAALARDRCLAQEDVRNLFRRARIDRRDVLDELPRLRAGHQFRVEQPSAAPLGTTLQVEAMQAVPAILDSIRALGADHHQLDRDVPQRSLLGPAVAERLADIGTTMPPQTPIALALRGYRSAILARNPLNPTRHRFAIRPVNEETLVGEYARLLGADGGDSARREPSLAVLAAATQLRAYAQEEPWFPGMPGPTVTTLVNGFGLRGVTFDAGVPVSWRPYYLRMLATSIGDMQRVLTGFSLEGASVRYGIDALPDTVLAMHDPATRTIRLSVLSSAGTLAHEFAHDLDWQAARRLYPRAGGYSTDHAFVDQRGPLATSLRGLAAARFAAPYGEGSATMTQRPAELFARDADWFVAVSLANEGRVDGYLSAVQDALLTGYAAASPRDLLSGGGRALLDAIQAMTYVADPVREQFLERWTQPGGLDPYLVVRRVLDIPLPRHGGLWAAATNDLPIVTVGGGAKLCSPSDEIWSPEIRSRQMLLQLALDARSRGVVLRWARWIPDAHRPAWALSALGSAPWSAEEGERMVRKVRALLATQLESGLSAGPALLPMGTLFGGTDAGCLGDRADQRAFR